MYTDIIYSNPRRLFKNTTAVHAGGQVITVKLSKYFCLLSLKPAIILSVDYNSYNREYDLRQNGCSGIKQIRIQSRMVFSLSKDRNEGFEILQSMDGKELKETIDNKSLHVQLGVQVKGEGFRRPKAELI